VALTDHAGSYNGFSSIVDLSQCRDIFVEPASLRWLAWHGMV
jgi:hypothetical protein